VLEFDRGVGQATERDRQPEIDSPIGEYGGECLAVGQSETRQHRDQDELDDAESTGGQGNGGQDVGQPVGRQQFDRRDHVSEGGDEDPERSRVEEPVGRGPADRPLQQCPVLHQHGEPPGEALDQ
jgi:hypothetical protein